MAERYWTQAWPSWVRRWYGVVLRVLVGGAGALLGIGLIWLAGFAATFKNTRPDWDGESLTILFLGIAVVMVAFALAVWPSRLTIGVAALAAVAIPVIGGIV